MNFKAVKPEDMLSDNQDYAEKNGTRIRKGTMAAALANAEILNSTAASTSEKQAALAAFKTLVPAIKGVCMAESITWKNVELQSLFE